MRRRRATRGFINVDDEVADALPDRVGPLGYLLNVLEKKETNDMRAVSDMVSGSPNIGPEQYPAAELEAAGWVNAIVYA